MIRADELSGHPLFKEILRRHRLVIALSGGADSVALLHSLVRFRRSCGMNPAGTLVAAHLHHGIRGAEADRDLAFVQQLCDFLSIPLCRERCDVPALAKASGESLEMAARRVRYDFLIATAKEQNCTGIAFGHHLNDQAETFFLRLGRGSSLQGLCGMKPLEVHTPSGLFFLRPFLSRTHAELLAFLRSENLSWCEDSTNAQDCALRNRIRHTLLPALENCFHASALQTLGRTMQNLQRDEEFLSQYVSQLAPQCVDPENPEVFLLPPDITHPAPAFRLIAQWLFRMHCPPESVRTDLLEGIFEALLKSGSNRVSVNGKHEIFCESRRARWIRKGVSLQTELPLSAAEPVLFSDDLLQQPLFGGMLWITPTEKLLRPPRENPLSRKLSCTVRAEALAGRRLLLRAPLPGDMFEPTTLPQKTPLARLLLQLKIPKSQRAAVLVLADAGTPRTILWLPGYAIAKELTAQADDKLLKLTLTR